ncbi:MAG: hypothetical protein WD894_04985 [Pirellulales bacterium]
MATATLTQRSRRVELFERVTNNGPTGRIDREAGVIHGVRVLGFRSKNSGGSREYSREAMKDAVARRLYEGVEVNIDHPTKNDINGNRPFMDVFGELRNVRFEESRGLVADLHYVKSHPLAESVLERAERFPERFGLSHHAYGNAVRRGDREIVEELHEVKSVDLVRNPASTNGLFESAGTAAASYDCAATPEEFAARLQGGSASRLLLENAAVKTVDEMADDWAGSVYGDEPAEDLKANAIETFKELAAKVFADQGMTKAQKLKRLGELIDERDRLLKVIDRQDDQDRKRQADSDQERQREFDRNEASGTVTESLELPPWQSRERLLLRRTQSRHKLLESQQRPLSGQSDWGEYERKGGKAFAAAIR